MVEDLTVDEHWVTIRRGSAPLDPGSFRLADLYHDHFGLLGPGCDRAASPEPTSLRSGHADRAGREGLDLGARAGVPRVRLRHRATSTGTSWPAASPRTTDAWRAILERPDVRERPDETHLVAARVRLPRARRPPGLRRPGRPDARRGRPALRELGPGRHRRRGRATPSRTRRRSPPSWRRPARRSARSSRAWTATAGSAPAGAATAPRSRSTRSAATTSTTSSTTSGTSPGTPALAR